jgi:hypothetical protein
LCLGALDGDHNLFNVTVYKALLSPNRLSECVIGAHFQVFITECVIGAHFQVFVSSQLPSGSAVPWDVAV